MCHGLLGEPNSLIHVASENRLRDTVSRVRGSQNQCIPTWITNIWDIFSNLY